MQAPVALVTLGFVGIGQTLDYDPLKDELILSGLARGNGTTHSHTILTGAVGARIIPDTPPPRLACPCPR